MVIDALQEPEGQIQIETVKGMLYSALEKRSFNSERADELFRMAIERAIWKNLVLLEPPQPAALGEKE
jgi:hypothetical protein